MNAKRFPLRVVLTVTTHRLLTEPKGERDNGIGDLYDILGWMTNDEPFTHQLPRFNEECEPWLRRWFPEFNGVGESTMARLDELLTAKGAAGIEQWLFEVSTILGLKAEYDVPRIPRDDHERKHPFDELVAMRGTDEGVIVVSPEVQP